MEEIKKAGRAAAQAAELARAKVAPEAAAQKAVAEAEAKKKRLEEFTPKPITSIEEAISPSEEARKQGQKALLPKEIGDILAARKARLGGFAAPELAGMQAQMAGAQQAAQSQRERALQSALAQRGVRGGAAAALQAQAGQQAARERAGLAQDLMLKQAAEQERARGAYEQATMGALDLANKQQFQQLAAKLGLEQMDISKEAAAREQQNVQDYLNLIREQQRAQGLQLSEAGKATAGGIVGGLAQGPLGATLGAVTKGFSLFG